MSLLHLFFVRPEPVNRASAPEDFAQETQKLKRRSERDRRARLEAEAIAERGLRELYEKKVQIELLGEIAVAANEATCVEDVLRFALAKICQTTGWTLGHAYVVRPIGEGKRSLLHRHLVRLRG